MSHTTGNIPRPSADDFFAQVEHIAAHTELHPALRRRFIHETLVEVCHEAVKGMRQNFGSLFAQVDYLCRRHNIAVADRMEIQRMRRNSNDSAAAMGDEAADMAEDILYDCRALALFISSVYDASVPEKLLLLLPRHRRPSSESLQVTDRHLQCVASTACAKDAGGNVTFGVLLADDASLRHVVAGDGSEYLMRIVSEGTVLSLVDCREDADGNILPGFIIVEPDYLIDISAIARCFTDYGHHPLAYIANQLQPSANSQAILLGNYSDALLDAFMRADSDEAHDEIWKTTLKRHFATDALAYATCPDFSAEEYKMQCQRQAKNIFDIAEELVKQHAQQRKAVAKDNGEGLFLLEPSFICPALGLQGRVDLMSADMLLLAEQKSGRNYNLERHMRTPHGTFHKESHYVQLLLYFAVLHCNFGVSMQKQEIRLIYSRYALPDGLLVVSYYRQLLVEALKLRNRIASSMLLFARQGFTPDILKHLTVEVLNENNNRSGFFERYIKPRLTELLAPLHCLSPLEEAYFCRMASFVFREYAVSMTGAQEGTTHGTAEVWHAPFSQKLANGEIIVCNDITPDVPQKETREGDGIPAAGHGTAGDILPDTPVQHLSLTPAYDNEMDFRPGDSVWLYSFRRDTTPSAPHAILYKGVVSALSAQSVGIFLHDPQPACIFSAGDTMSWAIEHAGGMAPSSKLKSLYTLMTCPDIRQRNLLLGCRLPRLDVRRRLSKSYHPAYDDILRRAFQAEDYFLLVGPPGTGKTSMAMRFMVEEELLNNRGTERAILLTSYTNRAVDEICGMLTDAGIPYLRIGNTFSCAPAYRKRLARHLFADAGSLKDTQNIIATTPVVVATTSTLMSHQEILTLRDFSLTVIDEASQILEPDIVGLLAKVKKFIMIGDTKQLPAVVQQEAEDSTVSDTLLHSVSLYDCRSSLFERLLSVVRTQGGKDTSDNSSACIGTLNRQGRMHPEIAEWVNRTFYKEEDIGAVPLPHQEEKGLLYDESVGTDALGNLLRSSRTVFIDIVPEEGEADAKSNTAEARCVAEIVQRIHRAVGDRWKGEKTLGVIVPYRNQIALVRRMIEQKMGKATAAQVNIDTVERYQGSQRDVIIFSFTIARRAQIEFLTANSFTVRHPEAEPYVVDRKLNVAITRARRQLILVGNRSLLDNVSLYKSVISACKTL